MSPALAKLLGELSDAMLTPLRVGAVSSYVTLDELLTLVTCVPKFPARSSKSIVKVTGPSVSLVWAVYFAVQVFPLVLL